MLTRLFYLGIIFSVITVNILLAEESSALPKPENLAENKPQLGRVRLSTVFWIDLITGVSGLDAEYYIHPKVSVGERYLDTSYHNVEVVVYTQYNFFGMEDSPYVNTGYGTIIDNTADCTSAMTNSGFVGGGYAFQYESGFFTSINIILTASDRKVSITCKRYDGTEFDWTKRLDFHPIFFKFGWLF